MVHFPTVKVTVLITKVTAAVDNHSVENLRDKHAQRATYACYVVKMTWQRENVIVVALKAFFRLQREPNLQSGHILVIIRTSAVSVGSMYSYRKVGG